MVVQATLARFTIIRPVPLVYDDVLNLHRIWRFSAAADAVEVNKR